VRAWPIIAGILVDLALTAVFAVVYGMARGVVTGAETADYAVALIAGLAFVLIGGYVAGRMARVRAARHGLFVGAAALVLSILIELVSPSYAPVWFNVASFLSVAPAGWLGGHLARRGGGPSAPV